MRKPAVHKKKKCLVSVRYTMKWIEDHTMQESDLSIHHVLPEWLLQNNGCHNWITVNSSLQSLIWTSLLAQWWGGTQGYGQQGVLAASGMDNEDCACQWAALAAGTVARNRGDGDKVGVGWWREEFCTSFQLEENCKWDFWGMQRLGIAKGIQVVG